MTLLLLIEKKNFGLPYILLERNSLLFVLEGADEQTGLFNMQAKGYFIEDMYAWWFVYTCASYESIRRQF